MKSILVIEDNVEIRSMLERLLCRAGYVTLAANDGEEGLRLFEKNSVDVILTDIFMPEHNGFELIKTLQERHATVKVIAMSGNFLPESDANPGLAETLGVVKTFSKPFDPQDLLRYLKTL